MRKLLLLIPLLTGCGATMESRLSRNSPYAPTNEINGGVVSYVTDGAPWIKEKRRESAYKQMYEQCNGPYRILEEGERLSSGGTATPIGGVLFYGQSRYTSIRFECEAGKMRMPDTIQQVKDTRITPL